MDTQSTLAIAAEVSIGIAGFSTIAAAIAGRTNQERAAVTWFKLRVLLQASIAVVLLSYLPMVLGTTQLASETLWFTASSLYLLVISIIFVGTGIASSKIPENSSSELIVNRLSFLLIVIDILLQVSNILIFSASWPYLTGLACGMGVAFVHLFSLLRSFWWYQEPQ